MLWWHIRLSALNTSELKTRRVQVYFEASMEEDRAGDEETETYYETRAYPASKPHIRKADCGSQYMTSALHSSQGFCDSALQVSASICCGSGELPTWSVIRHAASPFSSRAASATSLERVVVPKKSYEGRLAL